MVLVEDVTNNGSTTNESTPQGSSSTSSTSNTNTNSGNSQSLMNYLMQDKISVVLLFTRIYSILCTIAFIIPIFGFDPNVLFQKALMSSAATSALKLHQRMQNIPFQLNREYFAKLMIEDSFHYLLFSLIFMNSSPVTIVLMPIAAFALLHVTAYLRTLINLTSGSQPTGLPKKLTDLVLTRDKDLMRFVAVMEIVLAPTIVVMIFTGKSGIFLPFIYYRFICMRYSSRRNPYSRIMFYELRVSLEQYCSQPSCPQMVRNLSQHIVSFINRMAPPQMA